MSLSGKAALAMVAPAVAALLATGSGTAHAAGDLYGAIAVYYTQQSHATGVGVAADFPTQNAADEAAKNACNADKCVVMAQIHNECGSVTEYDAWAAWTNTVEPVYTTGKGATAAAAQQAAMDRGNYGMSFPSTAALFAVGAARVVKPLFLLDTICTSNAG
ncbi:DUF4189 domain-containing protein [Nocardia sp. NPDC051030]|uniref:DUF4189 domain-containing protein n=1 Tax=Nocardia sp. NPDC051030 TaxID=3155162 RepID=UPI003448695C